MRCIFLLLAAVAGLEAADPVSIGVLAGAPAGPASGRWTAGLAAEVRLMGPWSAEGDLLYRRFTEGGPLPASSESEVRAWDLPVLVRYRFSTAGRIRPLFFSTAGRIRPVLGGGMQFTHESEDRRIAAGELPYVLPAGVRLNRWRRGPVALAGLEIPTGRLRLIPEIRYVHLGGSARQHVTFLLGFRF